MHAERFRSMRKQSSIRKQSPDSMKEKIMSGTVSGVVCAIIVVAAIAVGASAQSPQPYAAMRDRQIKALSEQQIADLKAGRGMGLALAAELNGYPGPSHLLELADQLDLSADQTSNLRTMFDAMKAE